MKRIVLIFIAVALLYTGLGFLPGRTFAPLDLPLDFGAWKHDPAERVRVSNSLLSDVVVQFIPWDLEIRRLISNGELPWVNRFAGEGGPLFANPQTAMFSPFTWPRLLFGLDGWAVMALLKMIAAALSMYWLSRELDVPSPQAAFSAIVFATAGYSIVWLLWPHTNVFVLLPALAAAAYRLMKEPRTRNAALVVLTAALCTAGGHPETLFVGVAGIWIFLVWEAEKRREFGLMAIVPSSVGALLGFLLLAVQLIPFFAILGQSHASTIRPLLPHEFRLFGVLSQVLPGVLGSPLRGELDLTAVAGAESFNHRTGGYIGAIVLLAIAIAWRDLSPSLRRGLVIGIVALIASWYPPGLWPVAKYIPVVRMLALEYGVILFVIFGALASGPALAALAVRSRRKLGVALLVVGSLTLIGGLVPLVAPSSLRSAARGGIETLRARGALQQPAAVYEQRLDYYLSAAGLTAARRVAIPGALWLIAGFALWRRRVLLLAGAAAAELIAFGIGFNPAVPMTSLPPKPDVLAPVTGEHFVAAHFEIFPANLGTAYGVRDVVSYDVLNSKARVAELEAAGYAPITHTFNPILSPEETRRIAKLGVKWVLSRDDVANARRVAGPPSPAVGLYELDGAAPVTVPRNTPPRGLIAGAIVSMLAALAAVAWLRLYALPPVTMPRPSATSS